jgi:hypothetical protein
MKLKYQMLITIYAPVSGDQGPAPIIHLEQMRKLIERKPFIIPDSYLQLGALIFIK